MFMKKQVTTASDGYLLEIYATGEMYVPKSGPPEERFCFCLYQDGIGTVVQLDYSDLTFKIEFDGSVTTHAFGEGHVL